MDIWTVAAILFFGSGAIKFVLFVIIAIYRKKNGLRIIDKVGL